MEDIIGGFIILSLQFVFGILFLVWLLDRLEKKIDRIIAKIDKLEEQKRIESSNIDARYCKHDWKVITSTLSVCSICGERI